MVFFASLTFNQATFETRLIEQIEQTVGPQVAGLTREIIATSTRLEPQGLAPLISVVLILWGASAVFKQLRGALNAMFDIEPIMQTVRQTLIGTVKSYLISLAAALTIGLIPVLLLFASALAAAMPKGILYETFGVKWLDEVVRVFSSPVMFFILAALIFKLMPQARIPWRAIVPGALLTALLFWIGGVFLGLYVQNSRRMSLYGAAGSAIALLIWAYYSTWILLYGAKFIHTYAGYRGYAIVPHKDAAFVETTFKVRE